MNKLEKKMYPVAVVNGEKNKFTVYLLNFNRKFIVKGGNIEACYEQAKLAIEKLCDKITDEGGDLPETKLNIKLTGKEVILYIPYILEWNDFKSKHSKYIKKNVTIKEWQNIYAEKLNLNFSQLLQEAIEKKVEIYLKGKK